MKKVVSMGFMSTKRDRCIKGLGFMEKSLDLVGHSYI